MFMFCDLSIGNIITIVLSIVGLAAAGIVIAGGDKDNDDDMREAGILMLAIIGILLMFLILFLAFTIVLLVGLHKVSQNIF
ncbi:hypothetical protein HF086_005685 [Spodoptera exigua]|uniref:Uncharacterized protein n=1 Tax=Spodoptera exigua TaxID=7107 RepID=A0A922SPC7_SPOEX|nr:hypothetical protein HF086_005685 [Spodoptera exigua]